MVGSRVHRKVWGGAVGALGTCVGLLVIYTSNSRPTMLGSSHKPAFAQRVPASRERGMVGCDRFATNCWCAIIMLMYYSHITMYIDHTN